MFYKIDYNSLCFITIPILLDPCDKNPSFRNNIDNLPYGKYSTVERCQPGYNYRLKMNTNVEIYHLQILCTLKYGGCPGTS